MVITAVADRVPQRIAQLIYLDAFVPQHGQSMVDLFQVSGQPLPTVVDGWRVPHHPPQPRKTDQPLKTATQPIQLTNPDAARLPCTYVRFTQTDPPIMPQAWLQARAQGWRYCELEAGHVAPETHAEALAKLLIELAGTAPGLVPVAALQTAVGTSQSLPPQQPLVFALTHSFAVIAVVVLGEDTCRLTPCRRYAGQVDRGLSASLHAHQQEHTLV